MRKRIVFSVTALIAVLATPGCQESPTTPSTTIPPEFEDNAAAVYWYRQAAEQGFSFAQNNLGAMYANGWGVLEDSVLAHMWWYIADANGHRGARENRDTLERDMTRAEISRVTELARTCMDSDYQDCAP